MKRSSLVLSIIFALAAAVLGAGTTRAAIIQLNVSGILAGGAGLGKICEELDHPICMLGGDFVIDNSANMVVEADVTIRALALTFTRHLGINLDSGLTSVTFRDDQFNATLKLVFATPTPGSLVGYTGGPLSTKTFVNVVTPPPPVVLSVPLVSGSLTESIGTPVPEPSTRGLMLTGFAGVLTSWLAKRLLSQRTARREAWITS